MRSKITILIFITLSIFTPCKSQQKEVTVIMETEFGNIRLKLYNETPKHRDNYLHLIKTGFYKERIFHRIIKNFMIQGGDRNFPKSFESSFGRDSLNYTIPAEINRKFIHKRGALAAARMGDNVNPKQESNATQFYIVIGEKFSLEQLKQIEARINNSIPQKDLNPFSYTQEQIDAYLSNGGTPHLDMTYTVFGEIETGIEIVDKIAEQQTNEMDKPISDIKFSIRIEE